VFVVGRERNTKNVKTRDVKRNRHPGRTECTEFRRISRNSVVPERSRTEIVASLAPGTEWPLAGRIFLYTASPGRE